MGKTRHRKNIGGCRWLFMFGGMASKKITTHETQILASCLTGAQDDASKDRTPPGARRDHGARLRQPVPHQHRHPRHLVEILKVHRDPRKSTNRPRCVEPYSYLYSHLWFLTNSTAADIHRIIRESSVDLPLRSR